MILKRVSYGKANTPADMREYRIDGKGPVGTMKEFQKMFPDEEFIIYEIFAECDGCGTQVKPGKECSKCGLYMPSAYDLAKERIRQMEKDLEQMDKEVE